MQRSIRFNFKGGPVWVHYTPGQETSRYFTATAHPNTIKTDYSDLLLTVNLHQDHFIEVMNWIRRDEEDQAIEYEYEARADQNFEW